VRRHSSSVPWLITSIGSGWNRCRPAMTRSYSPPPRPLPLPRPRPRRMMVHLARKVTASTFTKRLRASSNTSCGQEMCGTSAQSIGARSKRRTRRFSTPLACQACRRVSSPRRCTHAEGELSQTLVASEREGHRSARLRARREGHRSARLRGQRAAWNINPAEWNNMLCACG